jgi:hypothetical protein
VAPKPASTSYYIPPDSDDSDSDDESSSDESLDHGGDIGPPACPAVDAVAPSPAPVPPRSPSPVAPPRPPSPVGIGARLSRCTRTEVNSCFILAKAASCSFLNWKETFFFVRSMRGQVTVE